MGLYIEHCAREPAFYRDDLVNLLHAGEEGALQDERDEELHARLVEARLASGERCDGEAVSGLGMGAVRRTASAHSAAAARAVCGRAAAQRGRVVAAGPHRRGPFDPRARAGNVVA